ncbi:MAG: DegV family protein, partial [Anaerolineales bacterium]
MAITILVDSTADLSNDIRSARKIEMIPMWVNLNGKLYQD